MTSNWPVTQATTHKSCQPLLHIQCKRTLSIPKQLTERGAAIGLVIERLSTVCSIPELARHHCVLWKGTLCLFSVGAKQFITEAQHDETL